MLDAILFDLDGTLLPMDNDVFTEGYLKLLSAALIPHGYEPKEMLSAMWHGVSAMVKNDGSETNEAAFFRAFAERLGERVYDDEKYLDAFYRSDFHRARAFTAPTPNAKAAVSLAREKAEHVVLATNPLFPAVAIEARLAWAGLSPSDFDLVTTYETSRAAKPSPLYYRLILDTLGACSERSLMIGNHADEDIRASASLGMKTFFLTDCQMGNADGLSTPSGDFPALLSYLGTLK